MTDPRPLSRRVSVARTGLGGLAVATVLLTLLLPSLTGAAGASAIAPTPQTPVSPDLRAIPSAPTPAAPTARSAPSVAPVERAASPLTQPQYWLNFSQTGVPYLHYWQVNLTLVDSNTTMSVWGAGGWFGLYLTNGTYAWQVNSTNYTAVPGTGDVEVNGGNATAHAYFYPNYRVNVSRLGLPTGLNYSVTITNATNDSFRWTVGGATQNYSLRLINGEYLYKVSGPVNWTPTPRDSDFLVRNRGFNLTVTWTPYAFAVTFFESGLPAGSPWSVHVWNQTGNGTGSYVLSASDPTLPTGLANATYDYQVHGEANYTPSPSSGTIRVDGLPVNRSIDWALATYPVPFTETGLPAMSEWGVSVGTFVGHSNATFLNLLVPNGSRYTFVVAAPKGYEASPANGVVTVKGGAPNQTIAFSLLPVTPVKSNNASGSSSLSTELAAAGVVVLVAVAAIAIVIWNRRRPPKSSSGTPPADEPPAEP